MRQCAGGDSALIVEQYKVILDLLIGSAMDAVEHFDERPDADVEAGLLPNLTGDGFRQRLTDFDRTARQTPFPLEWFMRASHEHDTVGVHNDRTDADNRPLRKLTHYTPITFTTTRFRRCPSNSA